MKVLLSWLRDFVDVDAEPEQIGRRMSLRGLALESIVRAAHTPVPPGRAPSSDDAVLDFDVTANRPDCLSVLGIAREIATEFRLPLRTPSPGAPPWLRTLALDKAERLPGLERVRIADAHLCARYTAAVASVTSGTSPSWMQARLHALGVRPISKVVDITNYVLLELGHPLHAFDAERLQGAEIQVRRPSAGETLVTLDGKSRALDADMLVIADGAAPVALAGVMGGASSEVSAETRRIVLESAWFDPQTVRSTSKRLELRTEASYRFERGADVVMAATALARAAALIEDIEAGAAPDAILDEWPEAFHPNVVTLTPADLERVLGMQVPEDEVERVLGSLGFELERLSAVERAAMRQAGHDVRNEPVEWRVTAPSWRVDIRRTVDVIEEVARHYGFEHLPSTFPRVDAAPPAPDPRIARDRRVRQVLLAAGFSEAITFAFIERAAAEPFADGRALLELANPLSEKFTTMRPRLTPGLIDAVSHNLRHEQADVQLFEIGTRFDTSGEERAVAVAWAGRAGAEHWTGERGVDFFDVKGVLEQLGQALAVPIEFAAGSVSALVDGRAALATSCGRILGSVGLLRPELAAARGVPAGRDIFVAEIGLDRLGSSAEAPGAVRPLPRFPGATRDLSILVDDRLSAAAVRDTIRAAAPPTLVSIREFDRYTGRGVPEGRVSLSVRLKFQASDRTLTDAELQDAMTTVIAALAATHGAVQR